MVIVSSDVKPPPHPFYGDSYERGLDPFHPDAFRGFSDSVVSQVAALCPGTRREGWFLIDGHNNAIDFIPDGYEYTEENE